MYGRKLMFAIIEMNKKRYQNGNTKLYTVQIENATATERVAK
jgi:hypothetical protein